MGFKNTESVTLIPNKNNNDAVSPYRLLYNLKSESDFK